jgi:hypothetical protein
MIAETLADGVPPNVAGDVLYLIGGPENVEERFLSSQADAFAGAKAEETVGLLRSK